MESMTGFGAGSASGELGTVNVQISSVNNRQCRVSVRSELRDLGLEERVRSQVQEALRRGSVTVQVGYQPATALSLDTQALSQAWRELAALAADLGAPAPTLPDAARVMGRSGGTDLEAIQPLVDEAVQAALAACTAMRATEGASLQAAFDGHHAELTNLTEKMRAVAAPRALAYAERLQERLSEVLRDRASIEPEQLVRELAMYADRIDVTEEQVRLVSHLEQLATLIGANGDIGKKIEFLLQELGREVNTTGAKANDADLQQLVVAAKGVVEQMKEQAANVV
ncbi:MAG: DUF1732 domain-containing protein [Planctomycetota bacterium]|jgi:uncharacterized protein (TIGR00255 family)|nr:DUF1732 domain-containing protein [Planctomycetota bacterium]